MKKYAIGEIIDQRPDGSFIYQSHKGVLNLDNFFDLSQEEYEDALYLESVIAPPSRKEKVNK